MLKQFNRIARMLAKNLRFVRTYLQDERKANLNDFVSSRLGARCYHAVAKEGAVEVILRLILDDVSTIVVIANL
jgi:hypothetical protein